MNKFIEYGTASSGNHGHAGRLGMVGGSSSSSTAHYLVSGRVQGVQFRANALDVAHALGLEAHARNLPSSQVEIQATGDRDGLDIFQSYLHYGNPGSVVHDVKTMDGRMQTLSEYNPGEKGFGVKNFSSKTEFDNHYGLVKTAGREGEGTSVTAYYERPIALSTKFVASLPGRYSKATYEQWDKHFPEADLGHNDRIHAIAQELRKAHDGDVITIQVTPGGKPTISEGGHVVKDAQEKGLHNVRAVVQFFGGGEKHWSPYDHLKEAFVEGGSGSGNFSHAGRKGVVGGSASSGGTAVADKPAPGAEGFTGKTAPWDMKAEAPPRYPGDISVFSPALKDANGQYPLGRRLQGDLTGKPPGDEVNMFSFIPGSASQNQLSKLEGIIKANCDHAQLHPGEIAFKESDGSLTKIAGNCYWIRGNYKDIQTLESKLTPAVAEQFGQKSAWSVLMTPVTPSGIVTSGKEVTHMRVVVPFEKDTPENTVGTPTVSLADRDKIMSIMAGDSRRVWQHPDFNGIHIATDIDPSEQASLNAQVKALGGKQDSEHHGPDAHNLGATRFIPKDINIEDYPVRRRESIVIRPRMIRIVEVGTASSGNRGHVGRKGLVGGSGASFATILDGRDYSIGTRDEEVSDRGKARGIRGADIVTNYIGAKMPKDMQDTVIKAVQANLEVLPENKALLNVIVSSNENQTLLKGVLHNTDGGWDASTSIDPRGGAAIAVSPKQISEDWERTKAGDHGGGTVGELDELRSTTMNDSIREVITHEMGHVFELQQPKDFQDKVKQLYDNAVQDKVKPLSRYAMSNDMEFFAEAYTVYATGHANLLSNTMKSFMDKTFKDKLKGTVKLTEAELNDPKRVVTVLCNRSAGTSTIIYADGTRKIDTAPSHMREGGVGSGNYGHVGRKGVVGGSGKTDDARRIAVRTIKATGGSFSTHGEPVPKVGYMVAENAYERKAKVNVTDKPAVTEAVRSYMKDFSAELARPGVYLGTWVEKGKLTLDNSHNIIDRATALAFAKDNRQIGVFNLHIMDTEYTRKDHKRPTGHDAPHELIESEEETMPEHKMFFAPNQTPEQIADAIVSQAIAQGL